MRTSWRYSFRCAAVVLGLLGSGAAAAVRFAEPGPIPQTPQRPGDAEAGYRALVNEAYVSCGMPLQAYRQLVPAPGTGQTLPGREGVNAELPYMFNSYTNADGVDLVVSNCLACHAGYFNGELIVGLGNETMDFTEDLSDAVEDAGLYVEGEAATAAWRKWAERIDAIAPYSLTDTIGVNPANNFTLALIMHRDPQTLAWSEEPLLAPPPTEPLPVSVPPWWRMQKKNAMFYTSEGRGDHARLMMTAAILCTDELDEAREIDAYAPDIRAYIASLRPPQYPFAIDRELAARGETVFAEHCSRCHGRYGDAASYPNLLVPLEVVGTDPALAEAGLQNERFFDWYERSFFGELADAAPAPGYVAPPLDGVWATAPYLHNGSVPSIRALLNSAERPRYWRRDSLDSTDYDVNDLGWNYRVLNHGKDGEPDWRQRKWIYDTTRRGYDNGGHTFGDVLSGGQRDAVLEYLKTL